MNRKILLLMMALIVTTATGVIRGQSAFSGDDLNSMLSSGYEMFEKAKYATAIELFDKWLAEDVSGDYAKRSDAEYHSALASIRLLSPDAEFRMTAFINRNPESPMLNQARLETGLYCYQLKDYTGAIDWLEKTDRLQLSGETLSEYMFKLGYSHFMKGDKKRALMLFSELKDIDTDYTVPSIYYHGCIAYEFKFYKTALEDFERLKNDETFGSVVPFYIVQIYYLDKNYDGILAIAPSLLQQAGKSREIELYRFIGDANFQKKNYKEAIPYLEKFIKETRLSSKEDKYQLAYCYYQIEDYKNATKLFSDVIGAPDTLTQNSYYMLGSCYLKAGDKKRAQLAFSAAANMSFDKFIQEESLFNFAKLAYENSYAPFGEGIEALTIYIETYPSSDHLVEAYNYLVSAYLKLKNYQYALKSLDRISNKDDRLKEAYQRVAYYRGVELFRNKNYSDAVTMFDKSLNYKDMDKDVRARTMYWRGEANYNLGNYDAARSDWELFRQLPGAASVKEADLVDYNLGYLCFKDKDYPQALQYFNSFNNTVDQATRSDIAVDARNRIADCYFIAMDYSNAIKFYDKVIDFAKIDADYATFQKAFAQGLSNDNNAKVATLSVLIEKYPASVYVPNALFERGRAYVAVNQPEKGAADFNKLINSYSDSRFVPPAMIQLGLISYNAGDNKKAVALYKGVIEKYPHTTEAQNALSGLRNAYTDMDDVDSYFAFLKSVDGFDNLDTTQKDSITYVAAESVFVKGNCEKAVSSFRNYLSLFPGGVFATNAHFYLADCLKRSGSVDEALDQYNQVISSGNNQFMEQALLNSASITYGDNNFARSYTLYEQLSKVASTPENVMYAYLGMMRSADKLGDNNKTIAAASMVLESEKLTEELAREATFLTATANRKLGNNADALDDYERVSSEVSTAWGAEAKYYVALLQFSAGDIQNAEKTANKFVDMNSPYPFWTGKIFLLLSDIAVKKGDFFQARATLQSLIDYYTGTNDGIIDEAHSKLQKIEEATSPGDSIKTPVTQMQNTETNK
jgi:TolA-binding protein